MSKKYLENKRSEILHDKTIEKWYFDACVLDEKKIFSQIYHKGKAICIISHLSLGEAFSNFIIKLNSVNCIKNKENQITAFVDFINKLQKEYSFQIVGHDEISNQLEKLNNNFINVKKDGTRLSISDAIHLATAGAYNCCKIYSSDRDLTNLSSNKLKRISETFELHNLAIIKV